MTGIRAEAFSERFPRLFHMAEAGSWPSIQRHGLLSTSALLDLFEVSGEQRLALEARHRPRSVTLHHPRHGTAVVRDQKPMNDSGLLRSLSGGLSPTDWYQLLNSRVFFWVSHKRLAKLLGALEYRDKRQTVLTVDTARLLARHEARVLLSPLNSGATKPFPWPRGPDTFLPMARYPFAAWDQKRKRRDPVVELTVTYSVPDIRDFVLRVEEYVGGEPDTLLFEATCVETTKEKSMADVGQEFKTGAKCETRGIYTFVRYVDSQQAPAPTRDERDIPLDKGDTFPPIKSQNKAAWWMLTRLT